MSLADDKEGCGHREEGTHWKNIQQVNLAVVGDEFGVRVGGEKEPISKMTQCSEWRNWMERSPDT